MGVTETLARFIVKTHYEDFDKGVVKSAKDILLNGLGAMVAGAREPVSQIAIKYVKSIGGKAETGVIGAGFRTSVVNAAYVGGITVHAIEQEACGRFAGGPPISLIPAAFTVAEKFKAPGKSVLEGFILGHEVQGRLGLGCPGGSNRGWSAVYFPVGSATVAAKIMNLDLEQMRNTWGIAADCIGGTWRHCGYMQHFALGGVANLNGVTAALVAKAGMTADPNIIEGEGGFGEWVGEYAPEKMVTNLGKPFYTFSPGVALKKYNACFGMHRALEALWQLIHENDIHQEQVASVQVEVPKFVTNLIHYHDPQDGNEAKFSFEHAFAVLLVDRLPNQMTEAWSFSDAGAVAPKYQAARKKVKVIVSEQPGGRSLVGKEMPVTIMMKDGRVLTKQAQILKGSPEMPLSRDEIVARFKEHTQGFLSAQQVKKAVDMVFNLEELPDISELMEMTTYGKAKKPAK